MSTSNSRHAAIVLAAAVLTYPLHAAAQATGTQTVRAAGMPLADGALPPGSLTVRIVRGAFSADVTGVPVTIVVDGSETRTATTAAQGRAEFAHLRVGAQVRTSAVVEGERMESEPFTMPAESGIRVLFVAGAGAGAPLPGGADPHAGVAPPAANPGPANPAAAGSVADQASGNGALAVRLTVASLTVLAFAFIAAQQWRRRRS